jgi:hypothetical protein
MSAATKEDVRDFWDAASCGETLYLKDLDEDGYQQQATARYELETPTSQNTPCPSMNKN